MDEMEESGPEGRRVVLLAMAGRAEMMELARALGARGHSLILWDRRLEPEAAAAMLETQFAVERAGGISLAQGGTDLSGAVEAFGRIDAAVALGSAAAAHTLTAAAGLERRLRPGRLVVLRKAGEEVPALETPAGMRIIVVEFPADAGEGMQILFKNVEE